MKKSHVLVLLLSLLLAVAFVGCEGEQGPEGPQGPQGPQGEQGEPGVSPEIVEYTFLGNGGEDCMHCHVNTVADWEMTGHAEAYADLDEASQLNPYCVQCHTTGWDAPVAYGDTVVTTPGPDMYGFDDYFKVEGDEAAARRHALAGVQCEACHGGMGPDFNAHRPDMSFSTHNDADGNSTSLCAPCHSGQLNEWAESGHATAGGLTIEEFNDEHYAHNSSCDGCHTSEGFIRDHDARYATYDGFPEEQSFIGCVTCHDPHGGEYEWQLRDLGDVQVVYYTDEDAIPTFTGGGTGQVCAQCHHARRNADNVAGQIEGGSGHFGPHGSPQMDMYIGNGSYEIAGYEYDEERTHAHQSMIENACVDCHMVREGLIHGELQDHSYHTFQPTPVDPDGNGSGNCEGCHPGQDTFDINGFQTEIAGKLDELAVLLGYTDAENLEANWDTDNTADDFPVWKREAGYAFYFVFNDGSQGVHNPNYATALLDNAIAYATANQ